MDRQIRLVRRPRIGRNDLEAIGMLNGTSFLPQVSPQKEELRQSKEELRKSRQDVLVEDIGDHAADTPEFSIGQLNCPNTLNERKGSKSSERMDSSDSSSFKSWTSNMGPQSPCAFTRLYDFANTRSNQRTSVGPQENTPVNSPMLNCKSNSRPTTRSNELVPDVDSMRVNMNSGMLPVIGGRNAPDSFTRTSKCDSVEFVKVSSGESSSSLSAGSSSLNRPNFKDGSWHRKVMSSFRLRKSDKSLVVQARRE